MPYFRSIDRYAYCVCLLHKYEAHIKGLPLCFSEVQVKNDVTDNNNKYFVTAFDGKCRNIIELREHLKLCFLVILREITFLDLSDKKPKRVIFISIIVFFFQQWQGRRDA